MIQLISVNVGTPREIGLHRGKPVISAIFKEPVTSPTVFVDWGNIEGDRQADQVNHGGRDKAIFAYSADHFPTWTSDMPGEPPFVPKAFGENLTVAGWTEETVRIGDIWSWGDALLQVAQPRIPCYKLGMRTSRPQILKRFTETGRTGWYLRVLQPGEAPVAGPILLHERHPAGVTVRDAHWAGMPRAAPVEERNRVAAVDALAENWRGLVCAKIKRESSTIEQS
jgi:MOSC domain-containing protein YiiM